MRPKLIIESPYAGDTWKNVKLARAICRHAIDQGYNPYASHLFFPGILNDADEVERELGIELGFEWGHHADEVWICFLRGNTLSKGVRESVQHWSKTDIPTFLLEFDGDHVEDGPSSKIEIFQVKES